MKPILNICLCVFILSISPAVRASDDFKALFAGQQTVDSENAVAVTFSAPLDSAQDFDRFVSISDDRDVAVDGAWVLSTDPQVLYFTHVAPDALYRIRVSQGLADTHGNTIAHEQAFEVKTREVVPMVSFATKGFILPATLTRGIPVDALNIDRVDIDFFRVKAGAQAQFFDQFGYRDFMVYYWSRDLEKYTDLVYTGRWDLDIKNNLRTRANIPIGHIDALQAPGIYFAVLRGAGNYEYQYSSTWFTISDIGLHARKYDRSLQLHCQSIKTAAPMDTVTVKGFTGSGRLLFQAVTDDDGLATVNGALTDIRYVTAEKGRHTSLLMMDLPALDLSEFKAATAPFRPVELFVYGPRDLYRPGETVIMDGLLRDMDGQMTAAVRLKGKITRPDGRMIHEFTLRPEQINHYHYVYDLPRDAVTGVWRVSFDAAGTRIQQYAFTVAEFLPERMALAFGESTPQGPVLKPEDSLTIRIKGDYLYGAPAAGSRADAKIHLKPARKLFPEKWPGFEFGDAADTFRESFTTDAVLLDDKGDGSLFIKNRWKQAATPLWLTANANLYESGGRPVVRNRSWQIWPADQLVGIRALAEDGHVAYDSVAEFDVMAVDAGGSRIGLTGLTATVIREYREYYWEYAHDSWEWRYTSQTYPVERFDLDLTETGSVRVKVPVKWGGYRLEIKNPATGLVSSMKIWAGWRPEGSPDPRTAGNRPDRVDIVLDKPAYRPGDVARITLKSPEGGSGYLFVESDTNLKTVPVTLPPEGKTIDIPVDPSWQRHDLYISALIVRSKASITGHLPRRCVGLIHLPLDRSDRRLAVTIDSPGKITPGRTVEIPVTVQTADGRAPDNARVTLAAVDMGILNLTEFATPSAFDYFFAPRKYGPGLYDVFQHLIDTGEDAWARHRFGGDAPMLARGGDKPVTDVQIVSIYRAAARTDHTGRTVFSIDIPEFNGSVRLMALAFTPDSFGASDAEMTIAAPVVTQIAMPRFLGSEDRSVLVLDVHNLSGRDQDLTVRLSADGPVRITGESDHRLALRDNEKQALVFPVTAGQQIGRSGIWCDIGNIALDGETVQTRRRWFLDTRPAFPGQTRIWVKTLRPGTSFEIIPDMLEGLIPDTIYVRAAMDSRPPINIGEHIEKLFAYPYGCLEQTTSGIYPHVILSAADFARLNLAAQPDEERQRQVERGIRRLMEKQKPSGGFGLWDTQSPEDAWLSAYAADFLINARQAGFSIPDSIVSNAVSRLKAYVRRQGSLPPHPWVHQAMHNAAARAYAAFVLARIQEITLGDIRALYRSVSADLKSPLGLVHAGLALYLAGDTPLARTVLDRAAALQRDDRLYMGDYGSPLRDAALSYYLLARFYPEYDNRDRFLADMNQALETRQWMSTQERNALVMAGSIHLNAAGKPWQADIRFGEITQTVRRTQMFPFTSGRGEAAGGFGLANSGDTDLFATITLAGYPREQPPASSNGVHIRRRTLDTLGRPLDTAVMASGDRAVVELEFWAEKKMVNGLIVDLLPAGLALEDPSLAGSTQIDDILVDKTPVSGWHSQYRTAHTEYRDDRFAAAVSLQPRKRYRIFYAVRAVTPGEYRVPPPLIEDMYRPYIRGIGEAIPAMTVVSP